MNQCMQLQNVWVFLTAGCDFLGGQLREAEIRVHGYVCEEEGQLETNVFVWM